jgi:hypothetical protein
MKVSFWISEKSLESLNHFIKSPLKYYHNIKFDYSAHNLTFPVVNVTVSYEDYEMIKLFKSKGKIKT